MSTADVEQKFRGNVGKRWPDQRTNGILKDLWELEQAKDISLLLGKLSVQA